MRNIRFVRLILATALVLLSLRNADSQTRQQILVAVNKLGDSVTFFDLSTKARVATIPVPGHPHEIIASPDGRTGYVSIYGDGIYGNNPNPGRSIAIIDLIGRRKIGEIDLGNFRAPHALALDYAGRLWAACDLSGAAVAVDVKERKVVGSVATGTTGTHWITVLPGGKKLYTSNKETKYLSVIDPASMKMTGKVTMPNGGDGLTVSRDGKRLFVNDREASFLRIFDTATDQELRVIPIKNRAMRVGLTPDERYAVLTQNSVSQVEVIDLQTFTSKGTVPVGKNPMGVFFPGPGRLAYIANHDDGTISVLDPDQVKVLETFRSDPGTEMMMMLPTPQL
jgi:DNA-binding beta-propeller fold protein YncE